MTDENENTELSDLSLVIAGEAGQGIQTIESILMHVLKKAGFHVYATKEYMSRVRGGSNSTELRIASRRVRAFVDRIDLLIALDADALPHLEDRIADDTVIVGEAEKLAADRDVVDVPFSTLADEAGGAIYANTVAVGAVIGLLALEAGPIEEHLTKRFGKKGKDIVENNITALKKGLDAGRKIREDGQFKSTIQPADEPKDELLLSGTQAVSYGAITGGCDFIAAYPMSPSTGVLTTLSKHAKEFGIVAEQAEDEIAALNMALGASYAGARAMVTTSGGGFALQEEALSLAGVAELPVVVHLAQRPGPATGLPTRTEQGDLMLALHAGHGEFPRIIIAPGSIEEAFQFTAQAFNLADEFQVPVFILTDQSFVDANYNVPEIDVDGISAERHVVEAAEDYQRYAITDSGVSPRAVPGHGPGLVAADSHTHPEDGHIAEDAGIRTAMVDKRLRKFEGIRQKAVPPTVSKEDGYDALVVCWGSTRHVVEEAVEALGSDDVACAHFSQVYPLPAEAGTLLKNAKSTVCVEQNATGQFARLVRAETGVEFMHHIRKYDGRPFSVEGLTARLAEVLA